MTSRSQYKPPFEEDTSRAAPHPPVLSKRAASVSNAPGGGYTDTAAVAGAAAGIKGRQRSLRGVEGERRDLAFGTNVAELQGICTDGDRQSIVGDELQRHDGTTSLQRLAQRSPGRTCLVFTSGLIVLGVVLAALSLAMFTRKASRSRDDSAHRLEVRDSSSIQVAPCGREACRRMGSLLKEALDMRNDPCDDFHAYVCGSWPTKHPGQSVAQALTSAFLSNVSRRAKAVRIPYALETRKQTAVQKAARHLVACDDIVAEWDDQSAYVADVLAEGGVAWPDECADANASTESDVLESIVYMSRVVNIPVLLEVTVESGPKQWVVIRRPENVASLLAGSTRRIKDMTFENYEDYFRAVYEGFSRRKNTSDFREKASKMSRLETTLMFFVKALLPAHHTRTEDGTMFTDLAGIQSLAPAISKERWLKAFRAVMNGSYNDHVPVVVHDHRYSRAVFALHKELGESDFAELYGWLCIQVLVPFTSRRIIAASISPGSQDVVLETHRTRCFANSDRIFHYALEYPYLDDVITVDVREDVGKLMQRIGRSFVDVLSRARSPTLANNCTSDALERSAAAYTGLFRRTRPEYFEDAYESYPDMTLSAVTNWIRTAPYVSALDERYEYDSFGDDSGESLDSAWRLDVEASYLDSPWYAVDAPSAIKIAGIGSRIVGRLLSELVLNKRACERAVLTETEVMWRCMSDTLKEQPLDAGDIKMDVVSAMLTRSILWETFRRQTRHGMNETILEDYPEMSESALFFVFGCIWSCGEDRDAAKTRCNLPLRYDVNFAETFSCATGSPMRPEVQCPHAFSATALG
ncbi:neprilysin-1-like [Dermacentor variabilis]|uniref:neprilysin-1-like n=1 Tax=Dermacentor variabilis TaxID=34621 RepID=UPI003F5C02A9